MNIHFKTVLAFAGMMSVHTALHAGVKCDAGSSVCFFDNMPLYSQNDEQIGKDLLPNGGSRSMLCGPTSGSMVLQAILNNVAKPGDIKPSSWTQKTFIANTAGWNERERANYQIRVMAKKMNTSATVGTYSNYIPQGAAVRKGDFVTKVADGVSTAYPSSYPISSYQSYVRDNKSAVVFMYGYYNRSSKVSNGKTYYSYTRNGGHIVALNGYSGENLLIYNPWYAVKEERTITIVKKGCNGNVCENLPGLSQRSLLKVAGNTFHFIDNHSRLWLK